MQFYGFVESENPNDQYQITELLSLVDEVLEGGIPNGRLAVLEKSGLMEASRSSPTFGTASSNDGFDEETVRTMRVIVASEDRLAKEGAAAIADDRRDPDLGASVNRLLSQVCEAELSDLPSSLKDDLGAMEGAGEGRDRTVLQFRAAKKRILRRCADSLKAMG